MGWIGNQYRTDFDSPLWTPAFQQSQTFEERADRILQFAQRFQFLNHPSIRLWVDSMSTPQQQNYESMLGGWPTGFYLFRYPKLSDSISPFYSQAHLFYQVMPRGGFFELDELWKLLDSSLSVTPLSK